LQSTRVKADATADATADTTYAFETGVYGAVTAPSRALVKSGLFTSLLTCAP